MLYRFGPFELDDALFVLDRDNQRVVVRNQILDLILYLVRNRERVVTRPELYDHLWGDARVSENSLATAINEARTALGDDGTAQAVIETVYGRGYRFLLEVEEQGEEPLLDELEEGEEGLRFGVLTKLFVGREDTLSALDAAVRRAIDGDSSLVFLAGEMGIGKSRTADELTTRAEKRGAAVVVGRCEGESGAPPFWPWTQIIRNLCEAHTGSQLREYMGPGASDIAEFVPFVHELVPGLKPSPRLEPAQARFRLFDSIDRFFRRCGDHKPLVLILEDLHAADASSLMLLRFLARGSGAQRVLIVATYRDLELRQDEQRAVILAELLREPRVEIVNLHGLESDDVAVYLESATGRRPAASVVEALHRRTEGNPFFLYQLVLFVASVEGVDALGRDLDSVLSLPTDLREAITRQLAGLSEDCLRALTMAAVFGRDFALQPLETLVGSDRDRVLMLLQEAVDTGVIHVHPDRIGHFRFNHMLVRDAVYDELPELARARLHERVGEALQEHHGAEEERILSELSHHYFEAARLGGEERALRYAERAAESAAERMGHEEAAKHFDRALQILEIRDPVDDHKRCDILIALGTAQTRAGQRVKARESLARAASLSRALSDAQKLAHAALSMEPGFLSIEAGVVDRERIELLEEALDTLPIHLPELRVRLLSGLSSALNWADARERQVHIDNEAREIERVQTTESIRLHAMATKFWTHWNPDGLEARMAIATEAIRIAEHVRDREQETLFRLFRICCLLETGSVVETGNEIRRFTDLAVELRQPQSLWYTTMLRSMQALLRGRFEEVEGLAQSFLAVGQRVSDQNAVQSFAGHITLLRVEQGRAREVSRMFGTLSERFDRVQLWICARAYVDEMAGNRDRALEVFSDLAADRFAAIPRDANWLASIAVLADTCVSMRDPASGEILLELLAPYSMRYPVIGFGVLVWSSAALQIAKLSELIGDLGAAEEHYEISIERNRRIAADPWLAHSCQSFAQMLRRRGNPGDEARAADLTGRAGAIASRVGMEGLTHDIEGNSLAGT